MIFVALTQGMAPAIRRNIAIQSCLTAVIILTAFAAFGEAVLGFVGVSIAAFRVAVDALLFLTALNMLFERRTKRCEDQVGKEEHSNLFSVSFGYSADCRFRINYNDHPAGWPNLSVQEIATTCVVMLAVMAVAFMFFLTGGLTAHFLGKICREWFSLRKKTFSYPRFQSKVRHPALNPVRA